MTDGLVKLEEEEEKGLEEWVIWKMFQEGKFSLICLKKNVLIIYFFVLIFIFFVFRFRNGFRTIKTKRNYLAAKK